MGINNTFIELLFCARHGANGLNGIITKLSQNLFGEYAILLYYGKGKWDMGKSRNWLKVIQLTCDELKSKLGIWFVLLSQIETKLEECHSKVLGYSSFY